MPFSLSPQGHLHFDEATATGLEPRMAEVLRTAAARSSAHALLSLATRALDAPLPPAGAFWRELGRRYLTRLCHTPDSPTAGAGLEPPPNEELFRWLSLHNVDGHRAREYKVHHPRACRAFAFQTSRGFVIVRIDDKTESNQKLNDCMRSVKATFKQFLKEGERYD